MTWYLCFKTIRASARRVCKTVVIRRPYNPWCAVLLWPWAVSCSHRVLGSAQSLFSYYSYFFHISTACSFPDFLIPCSAVHKSHCFLLNCWILQQNWDIPDHIQSASVCSNSSHTWLELLTKLKKIMHANPTGHNFPLYKMIIFFTFQKLLKGHEELHLLWTVNGKILW